MVKFFSVSIRFLSKKKKLLYHFSIDVYLIQFKTYDRAENMRILCGITDRTVTDQSLQVGHVKQYWKHPKYSQQTIDYDLCLFGKKAIKKNHS